VIRDDELAAAIRALLQLDVGVYVGIFGMVEIGELENGNFWVRSCELHPHKELWMKDDIPLEEAIAHFIRIRKERQIGYDIEADLISKAAADETSPPAAG
jgi:hypothetical protein